MVTITPNGKPPWTRECNIGDYGGDPNKENSLSEGDRPYAAVLVKELQGMRGSAYTTLPNTLVHCENLALARLFAWLYFRMPEKVAANSKPGRSDEKLGYWVDVLNISTRPDEPKWSIRKKCAAKYTAAKGPTYQTIRDALIELLGDFFTELHTLYGTLASAPPTITYWPGVNPGPASHDLGGGAWLSERCHLWVELRMPADSELPRFYQLVNVDMFQLLDTMLPAWATFAWSTSDGFLLDISRLDFDGMN